MISVICPVFNEEKYIKSLLEFFIKAMPEEKELLLIDGGSTDATFKIIQQYCVKYSNISLFKNADKYVPFALNTGVKHAKGDIIIRLDAHTEYAADYFTKILDCFNNTNADIVGGPMRAIGKNDFQKAVAYATSTKMGIGNSNFHFDRFSGFTDSVYLGAWKKHIFYATGLFDEKMKRNQDDEFHYRAKSLGFKTYQDSAITSYYYPRDTPKKLFKQYFEYGLYKPLVLKKIKSEIKLRHLIPAAFVMYLLSLIFIHYLWWWLPLGIYTSAAVYFAIKNKLSFRVRLYVFGCYFIIHIAYGLGVLFGVSKILNTDKPGVIKMIERRQHA